MYSSKEQVQELTNKVDTLHNEITQLHSKIDNIERLLKNDIAPSCHKMGGHIHFVENVYTNVRSPLEYIMNKATYMLGNQGGTGTVPTLPAIDEPHQVKVTATATATTAATTTASPSQLQTQNERV